LNTLSSIGSASALFAGILAKGGKRRGEEERIIDSGFSIENVDYRTR